MTFYLLKLLKNETWQIFRETKNYKYIGVTKERFPTHEHATKWIYENCNEKCRPWIDHEIDGYHGHLMTLDAWKSQCNDGCLIDYDGDGFLLDDKYNRLEDFLSPSDYTTGTFTFPENSSYVLWFNN